MADAPSLGRGVGCRRPPDIPPISPWRWLDLPSSRRTLCRYAHAPTTPEEPDGTRRFVPSGTAPGKTTLRASSIALSRLNRMAWRLAVYASPCQLPGNDARLACGCWLGFAARDSDPQSSKERFQLCVDHIASSSRELAWRNVSVLLILIFLLLLQESTPRSSQVVLYPRLWLRRAM
jgi:hypothetical protein